MKLDFTNDTVFSFEGPNLCMLGNVSDFRKLSESVLLLTDPTQDNAIELLQLDFVQFEGVQRVIFSSKKNARLLGFLSNNQDIHFELDSRYWERLFKYFVIMSWSKKTYYLNSYESYLEDLDLEQQCNFICSSEF